MTYYYQIVKRISPWQTLRNRLVLFVYSEMEI